MAPSYPLAHAITIFLSFKVLGIGNGILINSGDMIGISINVEASRPKEHLECSKHVAQEGMITAGRGQR
jgi:hypothetical protein